MSEEDPESEDSSQYEEDTCIEPDSEGEVCSGYQADNEELQADGAPVVEVQAVPNMNDFLCIQTEIRKG